MRKSIKYLVLCLSCVISFVCLIIIIGFSLDVKNLSYPSTIIFPIFSCVLLIVALVFFTIWAFKFSNSKKHIVFLLVSILFFIFTISLFSIGKIVNSKIVSAPIQVKNSFLDITVGDFEKSFNSKLTDEYPKAYLENTTTDDEYSFHFSYLTEGITLSVMASPDSSMISFASLSCNLSEYSNSATNLGYYYAKLIYALAPDITKEEITNIANELDIESILPNTNNVFYRNDLIYGFNVDDDYVVRLSIVPYNNYTKIK